MRHESRGIKQGGAHGTSCAVPNVTQTGYDCNLNVLRGVG